MDFYGKIDYSNLPYKKVLGLAGMKDKTNVKLNSYPTAALFLCISLLVSLFFPFTTVLANHSTVTKNPSQPNGTNGWYKNLKIEVKGEFYTYPCNAGTCTGYKSPIGNYSPPEGSNLVEIFETDRSLFVKLNSGELVPMLVPIIKKPTPDSGDLRQVSSEQLKVERKIKLFRILSPSNNANTNEPSIKVSGTAKMVSGVSSVIVNGKQANVTGEGWSVAVPLKKGLNQINAFLTSVACNTASDSIVVLYLPQLEDLATQESTPIFETNTGETLGESESKGINEAATTQEATISASPSAESTRSGGLVKNTFFNNRILTVLFVLIILSSAGVLAFKTEVVSRFVRNKFLKR